MKYLSLTINGTPMPAPPQIPTGGTNVLKTIISNGLIIVIVVAILFALFTIIRGGLQWTISGGDKQKIAQARLRIIYGIAGLLLVFLSFLIVNSIFNLIGG